MRARVVAVSSIARSASKAASSRPITASAIVSIIGALHSLILGTGPPGGRRHLGWIAGKSAFCHRSVPKPLHDKQRERDPVESRQLRATEDGRWTPELELASIGQRSSEGGPGRYCTVEFVELQRASCLVELGRVRPAIESFQRGSPGCQRSIAATAAST